MSPSKALAKFIADNDIGKGEAANALHVNRLTLWLWLNERATPNPDNQADIATYTGGVVKGPWPKAKRKPKVKPFVAAPTKRAS